MAAPYKSAPATTPTPIATEVPRIGVLMTAAALRGAALFEFSAANADAVAEAAAPVASPGL